MPELSNDEFAKNLIQMGVDVTQYDSNDLKYLYKIAKLCARQIGVPLGAATAAAMAGAGAVTLPVVGAVPGYVAGFLAGAVGGTSACVIGRFSMKGGLDGILNDASYNQKRSLINSL